MPATPSWKCVRMVSETMNSMSAATRPMALISVAHFRGRRASITAVAIGSQRMTERTWLMRPPCPSPRFAGRGWREAPGEGRILQDGAPHPPLTRHLLPARGEKALHTESRSCQHPHEDHHPREEHQRVVADVAGLQEAKQRAEGLDEVAEESEEAVDHGVDAAPEEYGEPLQRPHHGEVVHFVDVPLVLDRAREAGRHPLIALQLPFFVARAGDPPPEKGDERRDGGDRHLRPGGNLDVRDRSEEHTSELQSRPHLVCRLLLEKKKNNKYSINVINNKIKNNTQIKHRNKR